MFCLRPLSCRTIAVASLLALWLGAAAWSQEPPPAVPRVAVTVGNGPAFVGGTWGGLQLQVSNPREQPAELLCATYLGNDATLQFGTRMWLPPHARLRTWQPIRLPQPADSKSRSVEYHTLLAEIGQSGETVLADSSGRMVRDGALSLGTGVKATGFIDTKDLSAESEAAANAVYDLLLAARSQSALSLRTSFFYESPLPFYGEESLEALDCLVIADSRILDEGGALAALRRWLFGGGRVWVLLDQVDPLVVEALLGDEFACYVVDRVGLTQVQIDAGPAGVKVESDVAQYEQPVELVRVVAADIDVMYTVQGWPAAMLKRYGDGQLLVTTLAPAGWLRTQQRERTLPFGAPASLATAPPPQATPVASTALRNLAADFFVDPRPPLLPPAALQPIAREYIGYRIPSAGLVVGLLAAFNVLLVGVGIGLVRLGRLDWIGYVIPGAALLVSAVLIQVGRSHREDIPATVAQVQLVQALPGTDDQRASGVASLYSPSTLPAQIAGTHGGWAEMSLPEGAAPTRRLIWTDHQQWRWENLRQPAGLQIAAYQSSTTAVPRTEATATFSPAGLTGKLLTGGERSPEDVMLVTREGRISIRLSEDGAFTASADGVMSHGQFLSAALLTDEQNRRQRVLAELLAGNRRFDFPDRPHLFFWTQAWDTGIDFGSQLRSIGSTLVAVPLTLVRPAAGAEVVIPAPLIAYRAVGGPDGTAATGLFDNRQRQWIERSRPSFAWLEFKIPPLLLPFAPVSAVLVIEVTGPVKQLEIAAYHDGKLVPLETWQQPVGTLAVRLTDPQHLQLAEGGTLLLRVAGGGPIVEDIIDQPPSAGGQSSFWRIESLRLDLRGRVLGDDGKSTSPSFQPSR